MTVGMRGAACLCAPHRARRPDPSETLRRGSGSCRDFALLMIDGCGRSALAARFVSAIFLCGCRESETLGGGATHAWLLRYCPLRRTPDADTLIGQAHVHCVFAAVECTATVGIRAPCKRANPQPISPGWRSVFYRTRRYSMIREVRR